jgi:hypothetical protein
MTAISDLPRIPTGELRLTFRIDETTAALAISPALGHDPIRAGPVGSVMAGRLISRGHLDALPAGDGA